MCGDDLTRANVMKQAASLKDFVPDTLLPGISINTSPTDFAPIKQLRLMRFKGEKWELFGDIMSSSLEQLIVADHRRDRARSSPSSVARKQPQSARMSSHRSRARD